MDEDLELDRERIYKVRRAARKLAHNRSRDRVIRKLPQTMVVVPARRKRVIPVRQAINGHKRLTYILLLGLSMCAYAYDVDVDTLESVIEAVSQVASGHVGLPGNT